jgi:hypothetical protein
MAAEASLHEQKPLIKEGEEPLLLRAVAGND